MCRRRWLEPQQFSVWGWMNGQVSVKLLGGECRAQTTIRDFCPWRGSKAPSATRLWVNGSKTERTVCLTKLVVSSPLKPAEMVAAVQRQGRGTGRAAQGLAQATLAIPAGLLLSPRGEGLTN